MVRAASAPFRASRRSRYRGFPAKGPRGPDGERHPGEAADLDGPDRPGGRIRAASPAVPRPLLPLTTGRVTPAPRKRGGAFAPPQFLFALQPGLEATLRSRRRRRRRRRRCRARRRGIDHAAIRAGLGRRSAAAAAAERHTAQPARPAGACPSCSSRPSERHAQPDRRSARWSGSSSAGVGSQEQPAHLRRTGS